ncbi:MAG: tRNA wybutosine-synthesizing 3 family protein [Candidatus Woesearchaeota archaeon]
MKKDNSPQGYIDEDIKTLLEKINSHPEYETTSSCSGRIVLLNSQRKGESKWLFKSHAPVKAEDIIEALEGRAWFMQEPIILHVRCKTLDAAEKLLSIANSLGLKKSGITSVKGIMVEVKGTERIETVLEKGMVSEEYIRLLVEEANGKLLKAKEKIKKLEEAFS